jgi:hypothetical protein
VLALDINKNRRTCGSRGALWDAGFAVLFLYLDSDQQVRSSAANVGPGLGAGVGRHEVIGQDEELEVIGGQIQTIIS